MENVETLRLWGVRQNNLKNISVEIPIGSFTVICGPSGSGKSSLGFETLYAEGQRRYVESLSNYARQFLQKAPAPDIDGIENIPPSIAIEQKNHVKTSRSTVGTTTEIIDYLRLLYEKIGQPHCPNHKTPISRDTVTEGTDRAIKELAGEKGYIMTAVLAEGRIAKSKKLLALLLKEGYLRMWYKDEIIEITPKTVLPSADFHVVLDRVVFRQEDRGRLADSIAQAYSAAVRLNATVNSGRALLRTTTGKELKISEDNACNLCGYTIPTITSRLFNFSSPVGACTTCNGFGNQLTLDEKKIVPKPTLSIQQGALQPFAMPSAKTDRKDLIDFCKRKKISITTPWLELTKNQRDLVWNGDDRFYGVKGLFEYLETKKYKMHVRVFLARYKSGVICQECSGTRLRKEVQNILVDGKSITQLSALTIEDLHATLAGLKLSKQQAQTTKEILKQLLSRLQFLLDVGVHYLTLDRPTRTLSGGEYQRLNLANQLGMGLSQILYVLDEPTVGLHPRDNDRLISILQKLKELGNTLVVVEHDRDVIKNADQVIEMGPGSGHLGGEVMFSGVRSDFLKSKSSLTAPYIAKSGKWKPERSVRPVDIESYKFKITMRGCSGHNLKNVDISFPLNRLVAITGVSGSGKSSLVTQTLYPALSKVLTGEEEPGLPFTEITGVDFVKGLVLVDQKPVGKTSRSNPVSYMKIYDEIRQLMAGTEEAKGRGYGPGHFSLNVDGGRCPVCRGEGFETIDMVFMDDVRLVCEECGGKRFRKEILEIQYRGMNIDQILSMTVAEAMNFFLSYPRIRRPLSILKEVGLDYLRLGQPAQTLSGGESQRLKLAKEFAAANQRNTLYILDEPTTGLHFREVEMLMTALNKLIDAGGSVLVIEHNLEVVRGSDWVIEIGPDGGHRGGKVIFQGTPEDLSKVNDCPTSAYLRSV